MNTIKPLKFVGKSRKDLSDFPSRVRQDLGHELFKVQTGLFAAHAKALKGFGGASIVELIESFDGNAYRCVYTTKIKDVVVVLHAFQKKSKSGIATPQFEIDIVKARLKDAGEGKWK
jgi:phage-related protein